MLVIGINLLLAMAPLLWAPESLTKFLDVSNHWSPTCSPTNSFFFPSTPEQFKPMPFDFRLKIFLISVGNFFFCLVWERYIVNILLRSVVYKCKRKLNCKSAKRFKAIQAEVEENNWPWDQMTQNNNPNAQSEMRL